MNTIKTLKEKFTFISYTNDIVSIRCRCGNEIDIQRDTMVTCQCGQVFKRTTLKTGEGQ